MEAVKICILSQKLLFWKKLHVKQNSANKLLARRCTKVLYLLNVIKQDIIAIWLQQRTKGLHATKTRKNIFLEITSTHPNNRRTSMAKHLFENINNNTNVKNIYIYCCMNLFMQVGLYILL